MISLNRVEIKYAEKILLIANSYYLLLLNRTFNNFRKDLRSGKAECINEDLKLDIKVTNLYRAPTTDSLHLILPEKTQESLKKRFFFN